MHAAEPRRNIPAAASAGGSNAAVVTICEERVAETTAAVMYLETCRLEKYSTSLLDSRKIDAVEETQHSDLAPTKSLVSSRAPSYFPSNAP